MHDRVVTSTLATVVRHDARTAIALQDMADALAVGVPIELAGLPRT